ncbi:hypothetical protein GCM10007103_24620 [Salinimicrobium marinum]|uniref:Uncharacterized protein n=1 Tax=Salinimicrobium marinum TaxID=680283 RepID=A0A918VYF4_9FLAO|nr:hypothetical protein GCM10007103_24620 [Salinimicrobium marinum]
MVALIKKRLHDFAKTFEHKKYGSGHGCKCQDKNWNEKGMLLIFKGTEENHWAYESQG